MKWVKVFESEAEAFSKIPEKKAVKIALKNKALCLSRFENELFLTDDKCPHNGESLSKGHINHLGEIICPWHNYRYHLRFGRECTQRTIDLATYPIKIEADGVYIGID